MLTKAQLKELEEKIRKRFLTFRNEVTGERSLTAEELRLLKEAGILRNSVSSFSGDAYALGKIVSAVHEKARSMDYVELLEQAAKIPTTDVEERAIAWSDENVGEYIKGIESMMIKDIKIGTIRSAGDALRAVRTGVSETIKNRETVSQLQTKLRDIVDDKYRDWQRVAFTEMNNAIQNGIHDGILEKHGPEALVYKRPNPDACKYCKKLHLEPDGITPRIFKLSSLAQNNIGKKASEWEVVVDSTHPWCQCQLMVLPDGFEFVANEGHTESELKFTGRKPVSADAKKSFVSDEDDDYFFKY